MSETHFPTKMVRLNIVWLSRWPAMFSTLKYYLTSISFPSKQKELN